MNLQGRVVVGILLSNMIAVLDILRNINQKPSIHHLPTETYIGQKGDRTVAVFNINKQISQMVGMLK
jgi:hypothetical protein